ncbi:MAG: response regulator [Alphaproteobacteria bacterium]|nr:response regulator [Alphaproteobacteria bacterium]MDX5367740.1 response regulator [Alphaproteobacteria bacterium]MDX5462623.1 response regulator [Alphaproteobacteria bacterium]
MATILLAEDDDAMRLFLYRALKRAGHAVTAVGDGATALRHVKARAYDLLLSDVVMPGLDGVELARRAADMRPAMKIMFITGFAAVALNPVDGEPVDAPVVSKPFHLKDLVTRIEGLLAA